ncbi:hypothetical protein SLEP1_g42231 [Rubroshorea leprosula]|uniref:Reverse transcriptase domain-containing protein n=1 Tax=Rubroshorea leprosula TaxID=152421 RepID=A0AAV5L953_9ROSI|nr:hypothetical protein SLEP1_g42231 [Rubroshorea leprosula]
MLHGVNNQSSWIDDPIQVKQIVYDHFKSQYSSQSTQQVQPSFDHLQFCRLSEEDRILLEVEFTDDEIREAVSSCASDKAPGPDGFNFHFIKLAWGTIRADIINFIKEFHQNARLVKGINSLYITLVPKKKNPTSLKEFKPICTIGSIYKILAKVLANRLKKVIAKIISASQSAFIKGRQLVDCSFALNEIIHDLKIKRRKGIIFKADFEKAFDSVGWGYLDKMLSFLGFGEKWRSWINECLRSASISILVNGSPTEEFNMQRGLRQGNPLSPYLFLIVAEGFHALLLEAEKKDVFKGVVIDDKTSISHLQFADDTALICEASINSILAINMAASALNCKAGKTPFIYLGLPVGGNPHRHSFWKLTIEKFRSKLASWKGKLLSIGGRITLLMLVLSALPLFYFSIFKVPKGILKELIRIQKNFLWGNSDESKKIAWVNWERLTLSENLLVADLKPTKGEGWILQWRRPPFGRELDELQILEDILQNALDLLTQLCSLPVPQDVKDCWVLSIFTTAWAIWYFRNGIAFNKVEWDEDNLIELVKTKTFAWIKGTYIYSIHMHNFPGQAGLCIVAAHN